MKNTSLIIICLTVLIIQSCTLVNISVSEKRNPTPQQINLAENITLTTWGIIKVNKSHFFPSSFQIKTGDKVIYIDPVEVNSSEIAILMHYEIKNREELNRIKNLVDQKIKVEALE